MSSMGCRMAKNTVFTRRVCGVSSSCVYPCEISETQTKFVWLCIFARASSKPSIPLTLQKVNFFTFASLFLSVRR